MKKTLFFFIVILSVAISSCKKESITPDTLAGTIWKSDDNYVRLEFTSTTQLKFILPGEEPSLQVAPAIYKIDKSNIIISSDWFDDINGVIDGNTITFAFGRVCVVKKQ